MLIVLTSPAAIAPAGSPNPDIVRVLQQIQGTGNPVGVVSNHAEPGWFQAQFAGSNVQFLRVPGRQNGEIVAHNAHCFKLAPHDVLVLATKSDDVQMGKNGRAVLIAAGWSNDPTVRGLGIQVQNASELREVVNCIMGWSGSWWFVAKQPWYTVRALADLSSYNRPTSQVEFSEKVTNTVKAGGPRLMGLLTTAARSLLREGLADAKKLVWGVYPSSSSSNDDCEVLSDFTHRLRTTVSRVRHAERGAPLFIRHRPSPKRSSGHGGDRTDPTGQFSTIHLNPHYRGKLAGKHAIIVDDCTTYGVSFGVAAALLRRAGVSAVTGVALGKFGNKLRYYEIDITKDPFAPLPAGAYGVNNGHACAGTTDASAQSTLLKLLP